jgi:hypothetical protein
MGVLALIVAPHKVDRWFLARVQNGTASLVDNGQVTGENGSSPS